MCLLNVQDFPKSSQIPKSLEKAIRGDGEVGKKLLTEWGMRCHISNPLFEIEKDCIREATLRNPVWARMLTAIQKMKFDEEIEEQACFIRPRCHQSGQAFLHAIVGTSGQ